MSFLAHSVWETARQRAALYCQFHAVNEQDKQQVLDKACTKLAAIYGSELSESELIRHLIQEVQTQLALLQHKLSSHHSGHPQPGYRRAHTGPVLQRSSIRAAVLERI